MKTERKGKVEIYPDSAGEWRWRAIAHGGKIVADCGEGYSNKSNARRAGLKEARARRWPTSIAKR